MKQALILFFLLCSRISIAAEAPAQQPEEGSNLITVDNSYYYMASSFGGPDQLYALDGTLKSIHGLGIFAGFEKGLKPQSESSEWGISFGFASPHNKTKRFQYMYKWRALGGRFFENVGEVYTGLDWGVRYQITSNLAITSTIRAELIQRGREDRGDAATSPRLGSAIGASVGLGYYGF